MSFDIFTYGDPEADTVLIQMVDDHDMEVIEKEAEYIRELSGGQKFFLKAVKVNSWNKDLAPWPAPPVFGNESFGDGAQQTLEYLLKNVVPCPEAAIQPEQDLSKQEAVRQKTERTFIGGYSLAGLFALWAVYQTDVFGGAAAASPSIWFPGFADYMRENEFRAEAAYLSLGDREERTRNPMMAQVGNAIRDGYRILKDGGADCILEWNKGNHFKDPDLRTAKAFAWLMNRRNYGHFN